MFGARPSEPTEACLAEIEDSELFVGLYAHRYGYVPEGSEISITELEFDHARSLRRPTFCFFVEEGYPWPQPMIEPPPGRDKLQRLKAKIEKLVVRDIFTTPDMLAARVAASVGRYLLSDPRRHNAPHAAEDALAGLTDLSAAMFVDLMRLLNVEGGDAVRAANQARYTEFVDMAEQHFADFRIQVTRLPGEGAADTVRQCIALEKSFGWALTRLRRAPDLDHPWHEFATFMAGVGESVHAVAQTAIPVYYAARRDEVIGIYRVGGGRPPGYDVADIGGSVRRATPQRSKRDPRENEGERGHRDRHGPRRRGAGVGNTIFHGGSRPPPLGGGAPSGHNSWRHVIAPALIDAPATGGRRSAAAARS